MRSSSQVRGLREGSRLELGAQDVSEHAQGAYTGEVSAAMLKEFGARYAIVGHSERRQYHGETDAVVADKTKAALAAGITPIVCVGETLAQREAGRTMDIVKRQMAAVIHTNGHCISAPAAPPARSRPRRCTPCCARSSRPQPSMWNAFTFCMAGA